MILKSLGHHVETSFDGQDALERIQENPYAFDVLITDNLMPRLSGVKLMEKLHALNPHLKIIMITGFPSVLPAGVKNRPLFDGVLIKPFKAKDILECLKNVGVEKEASV